MAVAVLAVGALAGGLIGCTPEPTPAPIPAPQTLDPGTAPSDRLNTVLLKLLSAARAAQADGSYTSQLNPVDRSRLDKLVDQLSTPTGRNQTISDLRTAAASPTPPRLWPEQSVVASRAATELAPPEPSPAPVVPSGTTGTQSQPGPGGPVIEPPVGDTSGACNAPDGIGTLVSSASIPAGSILAPNREVWTSGPATDPGLPNSRFSGWEVTAKAANGTDGIEFRTTPGGRQFHVQVDLTSPKAGFLAGGLTVLLQAASLRSGDRKDDLPVRVTDAHVYCYANATPDRGYWDAWVNVDNRWTEPGVQLAAEVVDNDNYFAFDWNHLERFDAALSLPGPQLWAGADRATIHVGPAPVSTTDPIPHSVGAFVTALADGTPDPGVNVLTDTNGKAGDDLEQTLRTQLQRVVVDQVADFGSNPDRKLIDVTVFDVMNLDHGSVPDWAQEYGDLIWIDHAHLPDPASVAPRVDVGYVPITQGPVEPNSPDVPPGIGPDWPPHALQVHVVVPTTRVDAEFHVTPASVCHTSVDVSVDVTANAWVDPNGNDSLAAKVAVDASKSTVHVNFPDFDLDNASPPNLLACAIAVVGWGAIAGTNALGWTPASNGLVGAVVGGIRDAFGYSTTYVPGSADAVTVPGAVTRLVDTLDLGRAIHDKGGLLVPPSPTAGPQVGLVPNLAHLSNSWCQPYLSSSGPGPCPGQGLDLLGASGPGVVGDATIGDGQAEAGVKLLGRFPNVYRPTTGRTVDAVTDPHRDAAGALAGIGTVLDPVLANLALRHLAQGPGVPCVDTGPLCATANGRSPTTNGVLDLAGQHVDLLDAFGVHVDGTVWATPGVAPMITTPPPGPLTITPGGAPPLPPASPTTHIVVPDLRLRLVTSLDPRPLDFSVSASADLVMQFDDATAQLTPKVTNVGVDLFLTGGCGADFVNGYALSYALCGRGVGMANGQRSLSLTGLVDYIAGPTIADKIARYGLALQLPDVTLLQAHLRPTHFRFAQIAGQLVAAADMAPAPYLTIAARADTMPSQFAFDVAADGFTSVPASGDHGADTNISYTVTDVGPKPLSVTRIVDQGTVQRAGSPSSLQIVEPVTRFGAAPGIGGGTTRSAKITVTATQTINGRTVTTTSTRAVDMRTSAGCGAVNKPCSPGGA